MGLPLHTSMAPNPGANQYTGPANSTKVCLIAAGDITTTVNKGKWAMSMSDLFLLSNVHTSAEYAT